MPPFGAASGPSCSRSHRLYIPRRPLRLRMGRPAFASRPFTTASTLELPPWFGKVRRVMPFVFWWTAIGALVSGHMQIQERIRIDNSKWDMQESSLRTLQDRVKKGERIGQDELLKELELVGLRERKKVAVEKEDLAAPDASWTQVLLGQRKPKTPKAVEEEEKEAMAEFRQALEEEASSESRSVDTATQASPSTPTGRARKAPSANVYFG